MKTKYALFIASLIGSNMGSAQSLAPIGLMTDLLEETETVWSGGIPTTATLNQVIEAWQRAEKMGISQSLYQVAAITEPHPRFGWRLAEGGSQSAYQILVATDPKKLKEGEADVWDSGRKESKQCTGIPMEGKELQPKTTYCWTVKVWDKEGKESAYATPQSFLTAEQMDSEYERYPLRKTEQEPVKVNNGTIDFGKAAYGQLKLIIEAPEADTLTIRLGEAISPDGHVNQKPGASIRYTQYLLPVRKGKDTYAIALKPDGRNAMIKPHGKDVRPVLMPNYIGEVFPFRYCEVEGKHGATVKKVLRDAVHYRWNDNASSFECSDDILNKVWELCRYTIKATSFAGVYVDGDRERIPYEADALINQLSHYCTDEDWSMARYTVDYLCHNATWPTEWILQAVILAWNDYMYTGDATLIERNYDILKARTLDALRQENGLISTKRGGLTRELMDQCGYFGNSLGDIVDWPQSGALGVGKEEPGEADGYQLKEYNTVVNAFHYEAMRLMSQIAKVLGKEDESSEFARKAEDVKTAVNKLLLNAQGGYYIDGLDTDHKSLHASMMPMAFNMVPQKQRDMVLKHIQSRGMACSVYGAQLLLDALYEAESAEYALNLMRATHERSWYNMLKVGSTIALEAWDAKFKPNLDWNHAWGAAPANIIPRHLMGIQPLEAGWNRIRIKPQPGSLKWAKIKVPTIRGTIKSSLQKDDSHFAMQVSFPTGTEAEIWMPISTKGKCRVTVNGETRNAQKQGNWAVLTLEGGSYNLETNF